MPIQPGTIIASRYRVDSLLGQGGMAEVYKVWDKERMVFLAMKVLRADLAEDKMFLKRFKREAQTLATLQHPHIVRFYGLEQSEDLVFLLMEYIDGTTLRKEIFKKDRPSTADEVAKVLNQVCSALYYAHRKGYTHCDVKPANIMFNQQGKVYLSDFGIARVSENATATMAFAGTPAYMAPEQILGRDPTPQTDIYSLGIVLYEMLSGGERPFNGDHAQITGTVVEKIRWEHLHRKPESLKKFNPGIIPGLEVLVMSCIAKDPQDRVRSAAELMTEVQMYTDGIQAKSPEETQFTKQANKVNKERPGPPPAPAVSPRKIVEPSPVKRPVKKSISGLWIVLLFLGAVGTFIGIVVVSTNLLSKVTAIKIQPTNTPEVKQSPTAITLLMATLEPTRTPKPLLEPSATPTPTLNPGIHDCMYPYYKHQNLSVALAVFDIRYYPGPDYYYRVKNSDGSFSDRVLIENHVSPNPEELPDFYFVIENTIPEFCIEQGGFLWPPIYISGTVLETPTAVIPELATPIPMTPIPTRGGYY